MVLALTLDRQDNSGPALSLGLKLGQTVSGPRVKALTLDRQDN